MKKLFPGDAVINISDPIIRIFVDKVEKNENEYQYKWLYISKDIVSIEIVGEKLHKQLEKIYQKINWKIVCAKESMRPTNE